MDNIWKNTMDFFNGNIRNPLQEDPREAFIRESYTGDSAPLNIHSREGIPRAAAPLYGPHDPFEHQTEAEMARIAAMNYGGDDRDLVGLTGPTRKHAMTLGEMLDSSSIPRLTGPTRKHAMTLGEMPFSPLGGIPPHFL